jgi:hypothetical protein
MGEEVFRKAVGLAFRLEASIRAAGVPVFTMLSGGECTEHPDIVRMVEHVVKLGGYPVLLTNGMWLDQPSLVAELLREDWPVMVQVTNDPRFYPRRPPVLEHSRVVYVDELTSLIPLGRWRAGGASGEVPMKGYPSCFNLRSITRHTRDFGGAILMMRARGATGRFGYQCTPSITHLGEVVAGESRFCYRLGTVDSTVEELTGAVLGMGSCNRCGLEGNLKQDQRRAIGLSSLYLGTELLV